MRSPSRLRSIIAWGRAWHSRNTTSYFAPIGVCFISSRDVSELDRNGVGYTPSISMFCISILLSEIDVRLCFSFHIFSGMIKRESLLTSNVCKNLFCISIEFLTLTLVRANSLGMRLNEKMSASYYIRNTYGFVSIDSIFPFLLSTSWLDWFIPLLNRSHFIFVHSLILIK